MLMCILHTALTQAPLLSDLVYSKCSDSIFCSYEKCRILGITKLRDPTFFEGILDFIS